MTGSGVAVRAARRLAAVGLAAAALTSAPAGAQSFDVARPYTLRTLSDRPAGGPAPAGTIVRMDRMDGSRSGIAGVRFPPDVLRVAWRTSLGVAFERAPLVGSGPTFYVAGSRGDVVALDAEGQERWRVATGMGDPGPLVLLADETVAFVDAAGNAVGVRNGKLRWRTRVGRSGGPRPAPLALDDGGAIVATARELSVLDADGLERGRAVLPEPIVGPVLSARSRVVAVTATGAIFAWSGGADPPVRVGGFGAHVGPAAYVDDHTLVAVHESGARLLAYDLDARAAAPRASATGSVWVGPPAVLRGNVILRAVGSSGERIIAIDPAGQLVGHAAVQEAPRSAADAGPGASIASPTAGAGARPAPLWIDASGAVAFVSGDGGAGVVAGLLEGRPVVGKVADVCPAATAGGPAGASAAFAEAAAGLAPVGGDAILVLCRSGTAVLLARAGRERQGPAGNGEP